MLQEIGGTLPELKYKIQVKHEFYVTRIARMTQGL